MRSDLVFDALNSKNRFALCHEAFKAVRLLHKNNTRVEDTTNDALQRLAGVQRYQYLPGNADEAEIKVTAEQVANESPEAALPPSNLVLRANL